MIRLLVRCDDTAGVFPTQSNWNKRITSIIDGKTGPQISPRIVLSASLQLVQKTQANITILHNTKKI